MSGIRLTPADFDLLEAIDEEMVTFRDRGGRTSYRRWRTEHAYTTVTPRANRLLAAGLIRQWHSLYSGMVSGGVELTAEGRSALESESLDDKTRRMGFRGYIGCPQMLDLGECPTPYLCTERGDCHEVSSPEPEDTQ